MYMLFESTIKSPFAAVSNFFPHVLYKLISQVYSMTEVALMAVAIMHVTKIDVMTQAEP